MVNLLKIYVILLRIFLAYKLNYLSQYFMEDGTVE